MNHLNRREPQIRRDQGEGPGVAASARFLTPYEVILIYDFLINNVWLLALDDRQGALAKIAEALGRAEVSIEGGGTWVVEG